ncbi:hypothetical protein D1872_222880 [compost metagenome]
MLGLQIKRRCRFIKNKDRRVLQKDTRDSDPLLLSTGQLDASFPDLCIIALRQTHNKFMSISRFCRSNHIIVTSIRFAEQDVILYTAAEQKIVLQHHPHLISQTLHRPFPYILISDDERPLLNIIKSWNKSDKRRLSSTAHPNKSNRLSRIHLQRDIFQNPIPLLRIFEPYIPELNAMLPWRHHRCILGIRHIIRLFKKLLYPFP